MTVVRAEDQLPGHHSSHHSLIFNANCFILPGQQASEVLTSDLTFNLTIEQNTVTVATTTAQRSLSSRRTAFPAGLGSHVPALLAAFPSQCSLPAVVQEDASLSPLALSPAVQGLPLHLAAPSQPPTAQ